MKFDMNRAWSRSVELVQENFQLLAVIAGLFVLLPTMGIMFFIGDSTELAEAYAVLLDPTSGEASQQAALAKVTELAAPIVGISIVLSFVQYIGSCAMIALMGDARPTVGEAIGTGVKSVLSIMGAFIIFMAFFMIIAIVVVTPIAMLAAAIGAPALGAVAPLFVVAAMFFMMARFSLTMPAVVLEGTLNPFAALKRSWDITGPAQWQVLGFWIILGIAYTVISMLVLGIFGVIAAMAGDGFVSTLIVALSNGLLSMLVGMVMCALAVAIYSQLSGTSEQEVTETFE